MWQPNYKALNEELNKMIIGNNNIDTTITEKDVKVFNDAITELVYGDDLDMVKELGI